MPRPKKKLVITPEQYVGDLAALGHSKAEIARLLDIDPHTLDSRFSKEYAKGREVGKQKLRSKLVSLALGGNVTCLIFACKNLCGMSDKVSQEISTPDGQPFVIDDARTKLHGLLSGIASRQPAAGDSGSAQ